MLRLLAALVCAAVAVSSCHAARAQPPVHVELLGTWPAGEAITLHRNQTFYLHLRYTSDQPVHLWVQPTFEGQPVKAGSNTSRAYPAGSGEALGWFFLWDPGAQVDEVKITAGNGSRNGTPVVATFPLAVTAGDEPATESPQPAWLVNLRAAEAAAQQTDDQRAADAPSTASDIAIVYGFLAAVLAAILFGVVAPAWCLWRWRGGWRIAVAVPVAVMAFVILRIIVDTTRDPTSHNLWPFEILQAGAISAALVLVLVIARRLTRTWRTPEP